MSDALETHVGFLRLLAAAAVVVDLVAGAIAFYAEKGHANAFHNYWGALFWTTTQLLTVSSQLPNPSSTVAHVLDVVLELTSISIITSIAGSWAAFFHHRRRPAPRYGEAHDPQREA